MHITTKEVLPKGAIPKGDSFFYYLFFIDKFFSYSLITEIHSKTSKLPSLIETRIFITWKKDLFEFLFLYKILHRFDIVSISRNEHNTITIILGVVSHHFKYYIGINIPLFLSIHFLMVFSKNYNESSVL